MGILDTLTLAFINTFGITQPTEKTRRRASFFILGMLALVAAGLCVGAAVLFHLMHV